MCIFFPSTRLSSVSFLLSEHATYYANEELSAIRPVNIQVRLAQTVPASTDPRAARRDDQGRPGPQGANTNGTEPKSPRDPKRGTENEQQAMTRGSATRYVRKDVT